MQFIQGETKHSQVQQWMTSQIKNGAWPPGTPLPGVDVIAGKLGCSMGTVRRAELELASRGWLAFGGPGRPTVVIGQPSVKPAELIGDIREHLGQASRKTVELARLLGVPA